ncbi:hypothetical protein BJ138DRAFT_1108183, partial [Hygrophoropsis aurantiaca]
FDVEIAISEGPESRAHHRAAKLVVSGGPEDEPLQFPADMAKESIDSYLRNLFPELFEHLDMVNGDTTNDGYHWVLLVKSGKKLVVSSKVKLTGTVIAVPHTIYEDWEGAKLNSDVEQPRKENKPPKAGRQITVKASSKGKKRARTPPTLFTVSSSSEAEEGSGEDDIEIGPIVKSEEPVKKKRKGATDFARMNLDDDTDIELMTKIVDSLPVADKGTNPKQDSVSVSNPSIKQEIGSLRLTETSSYQAYSPRIDNLLPLTLSVDTNPDSAPVDNSATTANDDGNIPFDVDQHFDGPDIGSFGLPYGLGIPDTGTGSNLPVPPLETSYSQQSGLGGGSDTNKADEGAEAKPWTHRHYSSSSRTRFEKLAKPKANPWARK